jgi:hypothetical protein
MARTTTRTQKPQIGNPSATNPDREQRVRERAYQLWEADGKPHGRDVEYWERARALVGMEESAGNDVPPNPQTSPGSPRKTGVEQAEIQEKPGEFPDRLAGQGVVKTAPGPKRRARAKPKKAP